jgi:hypothetical protein
VSTDIVQCDNCGKVSKVADVHGWFEVRTYVTRPTQEYYDALPEQFRSQLPQELSPKPLPFKVGGDFCTIACLVKYAQAHQTMGEAFGEVPAAPKEAPEAEPHESHYGPDDYSSEAWAYYEEQEDDQFQEPDDEGF